MEKPDDFPRLVYADKSFRLRVVMNKGQAVEKIIRFCSLAERRDKSSPVRVEELVKAFLDQIGDAVIINSREDFPDSVTAVRR